MKSQIRIHIEDDILDKCKELATIHNRTISLQIETLLKMVLAKSFNLGAGTLSSDRESD